MLHVKNQRLDDRIVTDCNHNLNKECHVNTSNIAYRAAALVIEHKGSIEFLHEDSFHSGVRRDFFNTDKGIRRKHIVVDP
jgi:hypothetical protein